MGRSMTEKKVLKKLGIPDFRHLTKDKAVELVSMLDRVDPSVAKAVLEQYPQFAAIIKDSLVGWKENVGKALEENGKVSKEVIAAISAEIDSLASMLKREDVGEEERAQIAEKMVELAKMLNDIDKRNKDFILKVLGLGATVALGLAAIAASVLGVNVRAPLEKAAKEADGIAKGN